MYLISKTDGHSYPILCHGPDVFREALLCGAERIRVLDPVGGDYDLVYIRNADCRPDFIKSRWKNETCYPDYRSYDINSKSSLYLAFFRPFRTVFLTAVNEYTVALAEVMLRYTDLSVYSTKEDIRRFFGDKIPCISKEELRPGRENLIIGGVEDDSVFDVSFHRIGSVNAFHNVFFLQGQGALSLEKYRYAEITMDEGAGIGSVLNNLSRFAKAISGLGLRPVVRGEKIGHFRVSFLEKYFNLHLSCPDACAENTVFFPEMSSLSATMFLDWVRPDVDLSLLSPEFLGNLEEYADAIIGGRRFLGVLIRGTDYLVVYKDGLRKMAGVEDMIPLIRDWIDRYGYEGIFLATEDLDVLSRMRREFEHLVIVIAQERHSVSELSGHKLLAELEKENALDYDSSVAESTVNYFYALYMLSRCTAFICSGACNGYDLAVGFNGGRYERTYLFKGGV